MGCLDRTRVLDEHGQRGVIMAAAVDEIGPDIYRLSVYVPEADFMFNQFLVDDDEPLLFSAARGRCFPRSWRLFLGYVRSRSSAGSPSDILRPMNAVR